MDYSPKNEKVCAFDHEEVGSQSMVGADSRTLEYWLRSVLYGVNGTDDAALVERAWPGVMSRSFLFSCDGAHALHPNYMGKHQAQ